MPAPLTIGVFSTYLPAMISWGRRGGAPSNLMFRLTLLAIALTAMPLHWAWAANDPVEEDLLKRGVEDRNHQDDAAALELFRKAYAIRQSPRAEAQMGLAEMALGQWVEAEKHIDHALTGTDAWIRKNSAVLKDSLAKVRKNLGSLQVMGSPAGAEVIIEGERRGTLPMDQPIRVHIGDCRFDVRSPGFAPLSRVVQISVGALNRETVHLSELTVPVAPPPVAVAAPPEVVRPEPMLSAKNDLPAADRSESGYRSPRLRTTGMILVGAGVLAAGAGLTFGILAKNAGEHDRALNVYDPGREPLGHRYETLQFVGYGVGAALLVSGVTSFILGSRRPDNEAGTSSVSLLPSLSLFPNSATGFTALVSGNL